MSFDVKDPDWAISAIYMEIKVALGTLVENDVCKGMNQDEETLDTDSESEIGEMEEIDELQQHISLLVKAAWGERGSVQKLATLMYGD